MNTQTQSRGRKKASAPTYGMSRDLRFSLLRARRRLDALRPLRNGIFPRALFFSDWCLSLSLSLSAPSAVLRFLHRLRHGCLRRHRYSHDGRLRGHVTPRSRRERAVVRPPVFRYVAEVIPAHVSSLLAHGAREAVQVGAEVVDLLLVAVARKRKTPAHGTVRGAYRTGPTAPRHDASLHHGSCY